MRVLFTNAGRRTYMIEYALKLRAGGYPLDIWVSDCTPYVPTFHVSEDVQSFILPPVLADPDSYMRALLARIEEHGIHVVIPLSDLDLAVLARCRLAFQERGAEIIISDPAVVDNCMDKRLMFSYCRDNGLPVPESLFSAQAYKGPFPCVRKQIFGSGSRGFRVVLRQQDLAGFEEGKEMLQEFIDGSEYGLDILNDLNGNFLAACVKRKLLMRAGETDRSEVLVHPGIEELARRISAVFRHVGNMDVDVIEDARGRPFCIDFNPRFGGGYPATHAAGFDYLRTVLDMARGEKPVLPAQPRRVVVMKGISIHWCEPRGYGV